MNEKEKYDVAIQLIKTIKEINTKQNEIISDYQKYPRYKTLEEFRQMDPDHVDIRYGEPDGNGVILTVHRRKIPCCPVPPDSIADWLMSGWDDRYAFLQVKEINKKGERFEDSANRVRDFQHWSNKRKQWVEKCRQIDKINYIFKFFFEMSQGFGSEANEKELVFGFGLFSDARDEKINHPLFTQRLKIDDSSLKNDVLKIETTLDEVQFESDILTRVKEADFYKIDKIERDVKELNYDIFNSDKAIEFLKQMINEMTLDGEYVDPESDVRSTADRRFKVTYSPMFIVRNRKSGLGKFLASAQECIEKGKMSIPKHFTDIVCPTSEKAESSTNSGYFDTTTKRLAANNGESSDILLTKPANKEQLQIALEIEKHNAVEVQGPPGTGKTHTIANLIGNFLAHGKTVLVTSEQDKALSVLKDKLDPEIQPLCIPFFDNNQEELQNTISNITGQMTMLNEEELQERIKTYSAQRLHILEMLDKERTYIYQERNRENQSITYKGKVYSPVELGKRLSDNAEFLTLIPGEIKENTALPLGMEELRQLLQSSDQITREEEQALEQNLPDYHSFVNPEKLDEMISRAEECKEQLENSKFIDLEKYNEDFSEDHVEYYGEILFDNPEEDTFEQILQVISSTDIQKPWKNMVIQDSLAGSGYRKKWEKLVEQIDRFIALDEKFAGNSAGHIIDLGNCQMPGSELQTGLNKIREELSQNNQIGWFFKLRQKDAKQILKTVLIDGHEIKCAEEADIVLLEVQRNMSWEHLTRFWEQLMVPAGENPLASLKRDSAIKLKAYRKGITDLFTWEDNWHKSFTELLHKVGLNERYFWGKGQIATNINQYNEYVHGEIQSYVKAGKLFCQKRDLHEMVEQFRQNMEEQAPASCQTYSRMYNALCARDGDAYRQAYNDYVTLNDKLNAWLKRKEQLSKIREVAPDWAEVIADRTWNPDETELQLIYEAWDLKQLNILFDKIFSIPLEKREEKVLVLSQQLRETTSRLVAARAWLYLKQRLDGNRPIQHSLRAWVSLIKKIGKGTGKRAPLFKRQARDCMRKAQGAVPVWITPIHKVFDYFDPKNRHFDVVIVDEASQSSLNALAVTFLADKIIVVGDEKQVSPMQVGREMDGITKIAKNHLGNLLPNSYSLFDGKTSFYEIVGTAFQPIMLREHFRCVPEIIEYSNRNFYDGKIIPLRDAHSCQVYPPVINYHVSGKRSDSGKVNEVEADTIVALILSCLKQKEYENKTFGIITLLGSEQAEYIHQKLVDRVQNLETIKKHRILAGTPASFQGDERDVIFLSLVDDHITRKLATDDAKRRYNVAFSRARDQIWVVNSLDETTIPKDDLRYGLLEYATNYAKYFTEKAGIKENSDSIFEQEVAEALQRKGYHFEQQYQVGSYRIDMVVMCGSRKIALECDGERYHSTPKQVESDMIRQGVLERQGWHFIRIRGAQYFRNKERTIQELFKRLEDNRIYPEEISENTLPAQSVLKDKVVNEAQKLLTTWQSSPDYMEGYGVSGAAPDEGKATYGSRPYSGNTTEGTSHVGYFRQKESGRTSYGATDRRVAERTETYGISNYRSRSAHRTLSERETLTASKKDSSSESSGEHREEGNLFDYNFNGNNTETDGRVKRAKRDRISSAGQRESEVQKDSDKWVFPSSTTSSGTKVLVKGCMIKHNKYGVGKVTALYEDIDSFDIKFVKDHAVRRFKREKIKKASALKIL